MIGHWSTHMLAAELGASVISDDAAFDAVQTDSRKDCHNSIFVALRGENFDGHAYIAGARNQGAVAGLVEHSAAADFPQVVVEETLAALGQMGAINRQRFTGRVVAVTGSAGKTTVKEMVAGILQQSSVVCKTQGNFNNHIGVPLSLLRLDAGHQSAVFELGASGLGEIAYTVAMVKPHVSILNNAQEAHVEGFGSLQNIVKAKGEIISGLPEQGTAVLNLDDPNFSVWREMAGARRTVTFGVDNHADVSADNIQTALNGSQFVLSTPAGEAAISLPLAGIHNIRNALAAAAAAFALDIPMGEIVAGLETAQSAPGRLNRKTGPEGSCVLDDTYNASPGSMREALKVLAAYPGRRFAVLGHMAELGDHAEAEHRQIGALARELGIEHLWVTGPHAENYAQGYGQEIRCWESKQSIIDQLPAFLEAGDTMLIKGSRSAGMEEVVDALCDKGDTA